MSSGNPWTILDTTEVYANPWMQVIEHQVLTPAGTAGIYGVMRPRNLAIGVVPIDDQGRVTLVGQHRFPLDAYSWEIPEGGGDPAIEPVLSAARELSEETGLKARHWMPLLTMHLSNCLSDEVAHSFVAWGLESGVAHADETESLALRRVSFADALDEVIEGRITDSITVASLMKLRLLALAGKLPDDLARLIERNA